VAQISPIQDISIRSGLFFAVSSNAGLTSGPIAGASLADSSGSFLGVELISLGHFARDVPLLYSVPEFTRPLLGLWRSFKRMSDLRIRDEG
jgi:hypothetical protein